jgi:hypothetical protein
MFVSFFPRPKLFFLSAIAWTALTMAIWYGFASNLFEASGKPVGLAPSGPRQPFGSTPMLCCAPQCLRPPGCCWRLIRGRLGPFSDPH